MSENVEYAKLKARHQALLIEREFWVEQSRHLQNQVQQWQRAYAGLLDQLGKGVVTEESIADNLALAAKELREPITSVEAVRSLIALQSGTTQGNYTSVSNRTHDKEIETERRSMLDRLLGRGEPT